MFFGKLRKGVVAFKATFEEGSGTLMGDCARPVVQTPPLIENIYQLVFHSSRWSHDLKMVIGIIIYLLICYYTDPQIGHQQFPVMRRVFFA